MEKRSKVELNHKSSTGIQSLVTDVYSHFLTNMHYSKS